MLFVEPVDVPVPRPGAEGAGVCAGSTLPVLATAESQDPTGRCQSSQARQEQMDHLEPTARGVRIRGGLRKFKCLKSRGFA